MDLRKIFKKDTPEYAIPANLSKEDKKKVAQLIAKAKRNDGVPRTAQQSIPFERMFQDGICRVNADLAASVELEERLRKVKDLDEYDTRVLKLILDEVIVGTDGTQEYHWTISTS